MILLRKNITIRKELTSEKILSVKEGALPLVKSYVYSNIHPQKGHNIKRRRAYIKERTEKNIKKEM